MDDSNFNDGTRITVNYFPVITVLLIVVNFLVFLVVQQVVPQDISMHTDDAITQCLVTNYPQCLTPVSQEEYIRCGTDLIQKNVGVSDSQISFNSCFYDVKPECQVNSAVIQSCYPAESTFYYQFAFTPALFGMGQKIWTAITSVFLHENWAHITNNMVALLLAGMFVETRIGNRKKFLVLYLLVGIFANLFYFLFNLGSAVPALGASGAIFGLMGANLVLDFYRSKMTYVPDVFGLKVFRGFSAPYLVIIFLMQVFGNLSGNSGIAYSAHVGGFIAGVVLIFFFKKKDDRYTAEPLRN